MTNRVKALFHEPDAGSYGDTLVGGLRQALVQVIDDDETPPIIRAQIQELRLMLEAIEAGLKDPTSEDEQLELETQLGMLAQLVVNTLNRYVAGELRFSLAGGGPISNYRLVLGKLELDITEFRENQTVIGPLKIHVTDADGKEIAKAETMLAMIAFGQRQDAGFQFIGCGDRIVRAQLLSNMAEALGPDLVMGIVVDLTSTLDDVPRAQLIQKLAKELMEKRGEG